MSNTRPLVIASLTLGALALVGAGVWAGRSSATPTPSPAAGPQARLSEEREVAYRRLIEEANLRIARQNQMLAAAQSNSAAKAEPVKVPGESPPAINASSAAAAAYRLAPGARLARPPELVSYQGRPAYEVSLDRGTVYVDASTAEVLHDGTAPATRGVGGENDGDRAAPLAVNGKQKKHHREHDEDEDDDD